VDGTRHRAPCDHRSHGYGTPADEREALSLALAPHVIEPVQVHALRSRQSGTRRFVSMHVLVPGDWSVQRGHELLERIEADIGRVIPNVSVLTHLESLDDPASWEDIALDRSQPPRAAR
jgi:divalent metal cation (Fe/Co/Zn/Cd) transporter